MELNSTLNDLRSLTDNKLCPKPVLLSSVPKPTRHRSCDRLQSNPVLPIAMPVPQAAPLGSAARSQRPPVLSRCLPRSSHVPPCSPEPNLISPARNLWANGGLGRRPECRPSAANRTEVSHEEEYPGLMIIDAYSDLHGPQIKMYLKLAKGLNLLPLNLLNSAANFFIQT